MNCELLQEALDALKEWDALIKYQYQGSSEAMSAMQIVAWNTVDIIAALEAELAKPEQEPVAWMLPEYGDVLSASEVDGTGIYSIPLYTSPPRKEWVGLTDEEIVGLYRQIADCKEWAIGGLTHALPFAHAIEAKLKDKNL